MKRKVLQQPGLRWLTAGLWALSLWGLILPMPILADAAKGPDSFGLTYLSEGLSFEFARSADGGYLWANSEGEEGVLDRGALEGFEVLDLTEADGRLQVTLRLADGLGGGTVYDFDGSAVESGVVTGFLSGAGGGPQSLRLDLSVDATAAEVPDVIGPALAIGLVLCAIVAYYTDCIGDCSAGCGDGGMQSASEGFCGRCSCTCKPTAAN